MKKLVFIQDIDLSASPKVRDQVREDVVNDYAALMKGKEPLPPIVLFLSRRSKVYLLADGWHRLGAANKNKQKTITAEVRDGEYEETLKFALVANTRHGLRRSVADKKASITTSIRQWPELSNVALAKNCMVDDHLVAEVRRELESNKEIPVTATRISTSGKTRSANTKAGESKQAKLTQPTSEVPRSRSKPLEIKDAIGYIVPDGVLEYWNNSGEVHEMIGTLKSIRLELKRYHEEKDLRFFEVSLTSLIADVDRIESSLQLAIPYAVCTQCAGHPETQPEKQCRLCGGRGVISKLRWKTVPEEIRKMRERQVK